MSRSHELRIIAGRWRGRRWRFPADTAIRPTPDRVRETLFNWLAPYVVGARVLDLFAGSGALGLEALSRGAVSVDFVDSDARCIDALRHRISEWSQAETPAQGHARCHRADATSWLQSAPGPYDIVFVDPPYAAGLWSAICSTLEQGGKLAPQAFIYVEVPAASALPALPAAWSPWRSGKAGEVGYHLYRREVVATANPRHEHEA